MGALLIAYGLVGDWDRIGLLDTETGAGELYVHHRVPGTTFVIGEFNYWRVDPPFTMAKYLQGLRALEEAGMEAIVLDSTSHAWAGAGGLLDKQGKIAASSGNSYTAWRDVTPDHNAFVDAMLNSPAHIIATMRSKTEYVLEDGKNGKKVPRKIGMAPVQREGMDYEFTVMLDIDGQSHVATATKDRTSLFDGEFFKITPDVGKKMLEWVNLGAPMAAPEPEKPKVSLREMIRQQCAAAQSNDEIDAIASTPQYLGALKKAAPEIAQELKDIVADARVRFDQPEMIEEAAE